MTKEELIQSLAFIFNEQDVPQVVVFAVGGNNSPLLLNVHPNAQVSLLQLFKNSISTHILSDNIQLVAYSMADNSKDCIYEYDIDGELPPKMKEMEEVMDDFEIGMYDYDSNGTRGIDHLLIKITNGENNAVLYKKVANVDRFYRSNKTIFTYFSQGSLVETDTDFLRIGSGFQSILACNHFVFLEDKFAETEFNILENLNKEVDARITALENTGYFSSLEKLKKYADKVPFSRKLVKVLRSSPIINYNIDKSKVFDFIRSKDELKNRILIEKDGNEEYIVINSQKGAQAILDLFNDEFLISELTGASYQAQSKVEL